MILGTGFAIFIITITDHSPRFNFNDDSISRIQTIINRSGAQAIVLYRMEENEAELAPVEVFNREMLVNIEAAPLTQFYREELFLQIRSGDCDRATEVAKDSKGVLLRGLVCPIPDRGTLFGAIAAAYYEADFPLKSIDGFDPDAADLFFLGQFLLRR